MGRASSRAKDKALGLDQKITRQDFLNSTLLASGSLLLGNFTAAPKVDWNGFSGIGDYRNSNGNTYEVVSDGHKIRDRAFDIKTAPITDTAEIFDCVIVGGGISGLATALFLHRSSAKPRNCLILDNHAIFGGEAKRNEFQVDGQRLIVHQGSAMFFPPLANSFLADFYPSIGIDWRQFQYQKWAGHEPELPIDNTPYFKGDQRSGFYFGGKFGHPEGLWLTDPWGKRLNGAPIPEQTRQELLKIKDAEAGLPKQHGDALSRSMDSMTLEQYLCRKHGVSPETIRTFVSPVAGGGSGIGADALSAYAEYAADVLLPWDYQQGAQMFPGGNTGVARHIVKQLIPTAIAGPATLANVCQNRVHFGALDRAGQMTRIRCRVTVISVQQDADLVSIIYLKGDRLFRVKARTAVMAGGSWTTKHIVENLPASLQNAYAQFYRSPCLMANVAVTNWRFLYKLGITDCQWFEGIGNYVSVRKVATFGSPSATINPDSPVVLTLKILFSEPGLSINEQTSRGRNELFTTPFSTYERQIREQFTMMFGRSGFDARRDIAGIILNRWGHAYLSPQPGFFFGKDNQPGPGDLLRNNPHGRVCFANSDLAGIMDHRTSISEGKRAAEQALAQV